MKAAVVVGTRPELVKAAPVLRALSTAGWEWSVLFTGQHAIPELAAVAQELSIPVGREGVQGDGTSTAVSTIDWRRSAKGKLQRLLGKADLGVVVGDTDSALLGAELCGAASLPLLHAEAGLRLSAELEPEETNRRRITRLADWHIAPFDEQLKNLLKDGVPADRVIVGGDLSHLSLDYRLLFRGWRLPHITARRTYWVATIHRQSNLHRLSDIAKFLRDFSKVSGQLVLLCRRPDSRLQTLYSELESAPGPLLVSPRTPRQFLRLLSAANGVLTDSAGVQQEAVLGSIPALVMRPEVELYGSDQLVWYAPELELGQIGSRVANLGGETWSFEPSPLNRRLGLLADFLGRIRGTIRP